MDQQAKDRVESWLRDVDRKLGEAEASLASVTGALDEDGLAMRRALWLQARVQEAREDYPGLSVYATLEFERRVADFETPPPYLVAGAGI